MIKKTFLFFIIFISLIAVFGFNKQADALSSYCIPGSDYVLNGTTYCQTMVDGKPTTITNCTGTETDGRCKYVNESYWQAKAKEWSNQWHINCQVQQLGVPGVDPTTGFNYYYDVVCPSSNNDSGSEATTNTTNPVNAPNPTKTITNADLIRQTNDQTRAITEYIKTLTNTINDLILKAKSSYNTAVVSPSSVTTVNKTTTPTESISPSIVGTAIFSTTVTPVMNVGNSWSVVVSGLKPNEIVYATGGKKVNGVVPQDRTPYPANGLGIMVKNGTHTKDVVGDWQLTWTRADGTLLKTIVFSVKDAVGVVMISPQQATVTKGLDYQFTAKYSPDGTNYWTDVTAPALWYSSDEKIAQPLTMGATTVREGYRGQFRTLSTGGVTVTANYQGSVGTASLIVSPTAGTAGTGPVFTSNTTDVMKVGDTWSIVISGLNPNETIYATGGKKVNGAYPADRTPYTASSLGIFFKTGTHAKEVVGDWKLVWTRADGSVLKTLIFRVEDLSESLMGS